MIIIMMIIIIIIITVIITIMIMIIMIKKGLAKRVLDIGPIQKTPQNQLLRVTKTSLKLRKIITYKLSIYKYVQK